MVCACQQTHYGALTVSLVLLLLVKPEKTKVIVFKCQLISWDPGGNHGFLYGDTTRVATSENDITLHSNSLNVMHMQRFSYIWLYWSVQKQHHVPGLHALLIVDEMQLCLCIPYKYWFKAI
jgi:hypothetical protein